MPNINSIIEEWKDVPGWEGKYQASSFGRIKSLGRHIRGGDRSGNVTTRFVGERIMAAYVREKKYGHLRVSFSDGDGGEKQYDWHAVILNTFIGPCPEGMECCHNPDPDPKNNRLDNLRWGTRQTNADQRSDHGNTARGENHGSARLTEIQVVDIIKMFKTGRYSKSYLSRKFNVSYGCIRGVVSRRYWRHVICP